MSPTISAKIPYNLIQMRWIELNVNGFIIQFQMKVVCGNFLYLAKVLMKFIEKFVELNRDNF